MAAAAMPLIGAGISALAGLFGGGKQQNVKTDQTTHGTQTGTYGGTTQYNLNPFQQQLADLFSQGAINQYRQGVNLAPYASQQMQTIAGQGAANTRALNNILAQRGLSSSPAAAAGFTQNVLNSGNQMSSFLAGLPLLQRQLQSQSIDQMMNAFRAQPFNVSTSGQQSQTTDSTMRGTNVTQGNPLGGLFGGLGAGLFAPGGILNPNQSGNDSSTPNNFQYYDQARPYNPGLPNVGYPSSYLYTGNPLDSIPR